MNSRAIQDSREIREECGVFGIWTPEGSTLSPAHESYAALFALQHRGRESCGIAVNNRGTIFFHRDVGLVSEVFTQSRLDAMQGSMAIGHVRCSAAVDHPKPLRDDTQPVMITYSAGDLALAHNGRLVNAPQLRRDLAMDGTAFRTTSDAEVLIQTIARERLQAASIEEAVVNAMERLEGSYAMCILSSQKLIAARDPRGMRPLCMGRLDDAVIFASESCALDALGAESVRDIEPGEVVVIDRHGTAKSLRARTKFPSAVCAFEYICFARPDSVIDGASVKLARQEAGKYLSIEHPVDADMVMGVPDSGIPAAMGYARSSGIPYGVELMRWEPLERAFHSDGHAKTNSLRETVKGKRVVLVDDSIVRGATCMRLTRMIRDAGAVEVHLRISSPPFRYPCYFGVDIPAQDSLLAANRTMEEIREITGADSLGFLSLEALHRIARGCQLTLCDACFTGDYPMAVPH